MIQDTLELVQSSTRALAKRVDRVKLKLTIIDLFINATPNPNSIRALMADIKLLEHYLDLNHIYWSPRCISGPFGGVQRVFVSVW